MNNHRFKVLLEILETQPLDHLAKFTDVISTLTYKQRCKLVGEILEIYADQMPAGFMAEIRHEQICIKFPDGYILEGQTIDKDILNDFR